MRTTLVGLALLVVVPSLDAVPAPDPARLPKHKLEALKKKLPDVAGEWVQKKAHYTWLPNEWVCRPDVRFLRRIGPERAKAAVLFEAVDEKGTREPLSDVLLTVFLAYQDGFWTTERFEVAGHVNLPADQLRTTFAFLMLDIDEAAEKP